MTGDCFYFTKKILCSLGMFPGSSVVCGLRCSVVFRHIPTHFVNSQT